MARGGLLAVAAAALLLLVGALYLVGQPRRDTTPELGSRLACVAGQPIASGVAYTCADLAACASADLWGASPPPIAATAVYAVARTPASGDSLGNGAGGYVVVFDLHDGGQRRAAVTLLSGCRPASG